MLAKSPPDIARVPEDRPPVPVVHVKDGVVFANSKDVADYFEKPHADVLEKIRRLAADLQEVTPENSGLWYKSTTYAQNVGLGGVRQNPAIDMTRDGFVLLVMGFTRATIGTYPEVSLADARERATEMRRGVAAGRNPVEEKRRAREEADQRTFQALADRYLNEHARRFKRSAAADERNLRLHVLPLRAGGERRARALRHEDRCPRR